MMPKDEVKAMEGIMIGYTAWGKVNGGCGHIHGMLEEGVGCLGVDRDAVSPLDDAAYADRRLYPLVVCQSSEMVPRYLMRETDEAINPHEWL
jgi:hypothetical protein